jgi:putative membrane protein
VIPYLFLASAACSTLGIILAFAPPGLYPAYLKPDDPYGILALLRNGWGISAAVDQQAGGLLMWIAGGPVYLGGALYALARWYAAPEDTPMPGEKSLREGPHGE